MAQTRKLDWKRLLLCIAIPLAVGGIASLTIGDSMPIYEALERPPLAPPPMLFPIVWSILYVLMGIASYLVSRSDAPKQERKHALLLYAAQLFVNALWPLLFFRLQLYLVSFLWLVLLWVLVLLTLRAFRRCSKPAAWLMLPYLLWITFAGYLNLGIYLLNR